MKVRKNIIGFAVTVILLAFIGPRKVFADIFIIYNDTSANVSFVIVDSRNRINYYDIKSHSNFWSNTDIANSKNIDFYSPGCYTTFDFSKLVQEKIHWVDCPAAHTKFGFSIKDNKLSVMEIPLK